MIRLATLLLLFCGSAQALPLYAARGGRTCDNCHSLPNTWFDPPEISRRKCTMSCVGCHVDPGGGALRTVSGTFFGEATMPMFMGRNRPLQDTHRDVTDFAKWFQQVNTPSSQPSSQPTSGRIQPAKEQEDPRGEGAPPADRGWTAWGRPLNHGGSEMAWLDGRYDDLNADPLLLFGGDFRMGYWSQGPLFFPMQADLYASVHPLEHLRLYTAFGARGRSRSLTFDGMDVDDQPRFGVRDLWVMTDEWPFLGYLKVGRFLPIFGTRVADHTAYIRRAFGLSQEDPANRVLGAEIGFAANYPYFHLSAFKPSTKDARNPVETGSGWGAAISGGYRELGWQLGASAMVRQRPLGDGGDTLEASLQWVWNPWFYWEGLPLTYLGEATWGTLQRPNSGKETSQLAHYHQLAWTALNGVVVRGRFDYWDPDFEVADDQIWRPGVGLDLTLLPGLTLGGDVRVGVPAGSGGGELLDVFAQIHGYF